MTFADNKLFENNDLVIDRRKSDRIICHSSAIILCDDLLFDFCTIKDWSFNGAQIEIQDNRTYPTSFTLFDIESGITKVVSSIWKKGTRMGVSFLKLQSR